MDKIYEADLPAAIEHIIWRTRQGLRKTFDDQVAQVQMPKEIEFEYTVIIRKDDLQRLELTSRDATITTRTTGTTVETEIRDAAVSVTDETEAMQFTRAGGEGSGTTGGEGGTETTAQTENSTTTGGEGGSEATSQTENSSTTGGEGGSEATSQTENSSTTGGEGGTSTESSIDSSSETGASGGAQLLQVNDGGETLEQYDYACYDDCTGA